MLNPIDIIAAKRDGRRLTSEQIQHFVDGVVSGKFRDYQASALLMAIVLNGMELDETIALTESMMRSGRIVDLPEVSRPKVDKHSTGGVGDKVSLILAPLAASLGLCVPMMSGRGLGHTGGTLDKLESIPGFSVDLEDATYRQQLSRIHQAMIGQSEDMVPADRILYALRDVTSTVESIPLICASILSKKLAEGIDALVLDVKCGSGAFMKTEREARELAESLVRISTGLGKPTTALITRMEQPLGCAIGNSLEVAEVIDCLKGEGPTDLIEVTNALVAEMLQLGGLCASTDEAMPLISNSIESGRALAAFKELVRAQGGDVTSIETPSKLPQAKLQAEIRHKGPSAYMQSIDARILGEAARDLGAGRAYADAQIDPAVGMILEAKEGDFVENGQTIARIHYQTTEQFAPTLERIESAYAYSDQPVAAHPIVIDRITANKTHP